MQANVLTNADGTSPSQEPVRVGRAGWGSGMRRSVVGRGPGRQDLERDLVLLHEQRGDDLSLNGEPLHGIVTVY